MKISQKSIQYILLLLIVVIAVCAYQFGYVKYIEKANAVKADNKTIEARISVLNDKETHREEWTTGIEQSERDIRTILKKYGPGNTPQKSIMFVTKLEEAAPMSIANIAFAGNNAFFISSDYDEEGNPKVEMNRSSLSISYNTTYDGLKSCFDFINSYYERMNVNSFNANFNQETGQLSGSMIINLFGVKDQDHVYENPYTGVTTFGTDNIFGTLELNGNGEEGLTEDETAGENGEEGTGEENSTGEGGEGDEGNSEEGASTGEGGTEEGGNGEGGT